MEGDDPRRRWPGLTRLRPVLMTALAMVIGMLPMSLALARAASRMRRWAAR